MKSIKRWYLLGFGGVLIVCLLVATLTIIRRMQVNSQDAVSCIYVADKGMENALKINGKDISGAYSFSVTNTCNQDVTYEVKMDVAKESNVDLSYLYTIYNVPFFLFKEDVYYFIINIYYLFILIVRPAPRAGPQRSEGPLPNL